MKHAMPAGTARVPPRAVIPARSGLRRASTLAVLVLAGCSGSDGLSGGSWWNPIGSRPTSPPPATDVVLPVRAGDPLAAFAARARMGQTETVSAAEGGRPVTARLVRAYNAASGRECRELQFGSSAVPGGAPGATYCNDPAQGWVAARALLRGGAVYRP